METQWKIYQKDDYWKLLLDIAFKYRAVVRNTRLLHNFKEVAMLKSSKCWIFFLGFKYLCGRYRYRN